jgi:hypothetical protein
MLDKIALFTKTMVELGFNCFSVEMINETNYVKAKKGNGRNYNIVSKMIGFRFIIWERTFEVNTELMELLKHKAQKENILFTLTFEEGKPEKNTNACEPKIIFRFCEKKEETLTELWYK